jgi:CheY-like chemotaxis protein
MIDAAADTLKIMHIEDDIVNQSMIKAYLKTKHKAQVDSQSTVLGALRHLKGDPEDSIDIFVCDWMLPLYDAGHIIKELYSTGKAVIFYTCLEEEEIKDNVKSIIGFYPRRFHHVRKGSKSNMEKLSNLILREA